MHILQPVLFVCVLNLKRTRKPVAEIVARTGLQRLSVMHQGLDRVSRHRARKLLFICLAALHHRYRENLLAEIRIDV